MQEKKQQKRRDKPTKGRFANTIKNNKKVSKVRRAARGLPAVKKQVRRAIYPPATNPAFRRQAHLKPPRSLAFCPYPPDPGLSFFPFFLLRNVLQKGNPPTPSFFSIENFSVERKKQTPLCKHFPKRKKDKKESPATGPDGTKKQGNGAVYGAVGRGGLNSGVDLSF